MITASTSRRLITEAIPAPSAATARSISSVASAPEDAHQRLVGTAGPEAELGLGGDLHVVANLRRGPELLAQPGPELEGAVPAGEVSGLGHFARALVDVPGRAHAHAGHLVR